MKSASQLKLLNTMYDDCLIKFFVAEQDADISSFLLEAIIDMLGMPPPWTALPLGAPVCHPERGNGVLKGISPDGKRIISFGAESHRYNMQSMKKFKFALENCTKALVPDIKDMLQRALILCVVWDAPELIQRVLTSSARAPRAGAGRLPEVTMALQRALELQKLRAMQELLKLPGIELGTINMCRLYTQSDDVVRRHQSLHNEMSLYGRLELSKKLTPRHAFELYRRALTPIFKSILPGMQTLLLRSRCTQAHDIFLWLVFHGNIELARHIWPLCALPIHVALLGVAVSKRVAGLMTAQAAQLAAERAETLELWAFGAMEMASSEEQVQHILSLSIDDNDALAIAYGTHAKKFLTQRSVQERLDLLWRGGFEESLVTLHKEFSWSYVSIPRRHSTRSVVLHEGGLPHPRRLPLPAAALSMSRESPHNPASPQSAAATVAVIPPHLLPARFLASQLILQAICPVCCPFLWKNEAQHGSSSTDYGAATYFETLATAYKLANVERERARSVHTPRPVVRRSLGWVEGRGPLSPRQGEAARRCAETIDANNGAADGEHTSLARVRRSIPRTLPFIRINRGAVQQLHEPAPPSHLPHTSRLVSKLKSFYSVPAVSFMLAGLVSIFGLVLHTIVILNFEHRVENSKIPDHIQALELIWFVIHTLMLLDKIDRIAFRSFATRDMFHAISTLSTLLLISSLCLRVFVFIAQGVDDDTFQKTYDAFQVTMAFNAIPMCILLLRYAALYKPLGVLIISISEMGTDLANFLGLLVAITFGFVLCLVGMQFTDNLKTDGNWWDPRGGMWVPMWGLFGESSPEQYNFLTAVVSWSYNFIGSVVLVNLLVAMFADTFSRVKESSEEEYAALKYNWMRTSRETVPPVLNAPFIIARVATVYGGRMVRCVVRLHRRLPSLTVIFQSRTAILRRAKQANDEFSFPRSVRHGVARVDHSILTAALACRSMLGLSKSVNESVRHLEESIHISGGLLEPTDASAPSARDGKLLVEKFLEAQLYKEQHTAGAIASSVRDLLQELVQRQSIELTALSQRHTTELSSLAVRHVPPPMRTHLACTGFLP